MNQASNAIEHKPVFMPKINSNNLVKTDMIRIERHVGFSSRQKKKPSMICIKLFVKSTAISKY